jgi:uncharacterized phage-associated protein
LAKCNINDETISKEILLADIEFKCNPEKTTQTLNYYAIKAGGKINKLRALKLIYFADKYHLRKYGRLVTNDNYFAMEHGPVPSAAKDIAESNFDYSCDIPEEYCTRYIVPDEDFSFRSVFPVDESVFSESDLEALNFAWDHFGRYNRWELRDLTHNYIEWRRHKEEIDSGVLSVPMDLLDFLEEPLSDVDACFKLNEQEKALRREQLQEQAHLESLWS